MPPLISALIVIYLVGDLVVSYFVAKEPVVWKLLKWIIGIIRDLIILPIKAFSWVSRQISEIKESEDPKVTLSLKCKKLFRFIKRAFAIVFISVVVLIQAIIALSAWNDYKNSDGRLTFKESYVMNYKRMSFIYAIYNGVKLTIEERSPSSDGSNQ